MSDSQPIEDRGEAMTVDEVCLKLGLSRGGLAQLFRVRPETVSRWREVPHYVVLYVRLWERLEGSDAG